MDGKQDGTIVAEKYGSEAAVYAKEAPVDPSGLDGPGFGLEKDRIVTPVEIEDGGSRRATDSTDVTLAHHDTARIHSGEDEEGDSDEDVAAADDEDASPRNDLEATPTKASSTGPPYTAFSSAQKWLIVGVSAYGGFISPLSGSIYLPALNVLAAQFSVTPSQINLTLTTYMIFQGLTPMFVGNFADTVGYRPTFILCFVVYLIANVGLACQNSYVALMLLRCLQSMGSSATVALRNGVIASVVPPARRGTALGVVGIGTLCAPAFGPVMGGGLIAALGWRWVFWFLAILSATCLLSQALLVPETNRKIVGNGCVPPYEWWNRSTFDRRGENGTRSWKDREEYETARQEAGLPPRTKIGWPDPRPSLVVITEKDTGVALLVIALNFAALYDLMASIPVLYERIYGLDTVKISLCYIALGMGAAVASLGIGRVQDYNWRRVAKQEGITIHKRRGQDLRNFPVEKARIQASLPMTAVGAIAVIVYGWMLQIQTSIAAPLTVLFFAALGICGGFQSLGNLLIDQYPEKPSSVTAASNITRCLLGAAATAVINPMLDGMGIGWCFTLHGLLLFACIPLMMLLVRKGPQWREERRLRLDSERERKIASIPS